ncbi:hypothetical protein MRB53_037132 [Persea americana]|nr:hypothetical protein MRB53_037132 [Persea americana]
MGESYIPPISTDLLITLLAVALVALLGTAALIYRCHKFFFTTNAGRRKEPIVSWVDREKRDFFTSTSGPPPSQLPEIRITFPEEVDDEGKRHSGRVVVVHVGENGVGLEPIDDLPPYVPAGADVTTQSTLTEPEARRRPKWC